MPIEKELRFSIRDHRFDQVLLAVHRERRLGHFTLEPLGTHVHSDTYFDCNGWLLSHGWSLRVRRRDDDVRITLKRPLPGDGEHGVVHDEIENPKDGQFTEVAERVLSILNDAGAISIQASAISGRLMLEGVFAAFRGCGLLNLFTVETTRHAWAATVDRDQVAEVVLDDSSYHIDELADPKPIRECRMEVELVDSSRADLLAEISQCVRSRFNLEEVHDSKFDRGMLYYSTRKLRDKMEAKITVRELDDYTSIINYIENAENFVRDYRFTRLPHRKITDTYFDTSAYDLFRAGCYLRLREESKVRELTFRRLTKDVQYGQVLQQEIQAKGGGESFGRSWRLIGDWLERTAGIRAASERPSLASIEATLVSLRMQRVLDVDIVRLPWLVSRVDPQRGWRSDHASHIAKVKYDQIIYHRPGDDDNVVRDVEFEVAGVEDEGAGLLEAEIAAYETFLNQFAEACAHASANGNAIKHISAKYFHGMLGLGIVKQAPEWLADGRLAVSLSLLREATADSPAMSIQQRERLLGQQRATAENAIALRGYVASVREELRETPELVPERAHDIDARLQEIEDAITRLASGINVTVIQNVTQNAELDLSALAIELERMLPRFDHKDSRIRAQIETARDAARAGDAASVRKHLQGLGRRALEIAQDVGAGAAAAIIAAKLGG